MKWPNDAEAPVLLFIDDLCNKWIDTKCDGILTPENDWGYGGLSKNSVYRYLENEILSVNPEVKVTFFVPVGKRADIIINSKYKSHSYAINHNQKSKSFFSYIHNETRHELAYHGLTHGTLVDETNDFIQEWTGFENLERAIEVIDKGKKIFKEVTGEYPIGGKYCGYQSNTMSDKSIKATDFQWWCRYPDYRKIEKELDERYGPKLNAMESYNVRCFDKIIDIPTTLNGGMFSSVLYPKGIRKKIKVFFRKENIMTNQIGKIKHLLENNYIISIQEHISPSREDIKRQTPNIIDDRESLIFILEYLKNKNVWYCTCTELANWIKASW